MTTLYRTNCWRH